MANVVAKQAAEGKAGKQNSGAAKPAGETRQPASRETRAAESKSRKRTGSTGEVHAPKRVSAGGKLFTMMEVCREADMTYQTLKFYCNQGLVPNVKRDKNNRRVFDERDMEWVKSLVCLKKCGMSIDEMREYLQLCLKGQASIPERKEMLAEKRARLLEQIAELEASVEFIDWKQGFYDDVLSGKTEYFSNLIPVDE